MKSSPHPQQLFMPEALDAWALDDFGDLALPRKAFTEESFQVFRGRSGPPALEQHLLESLFNPHIGETS